VSEETQVYPGAYCVVCKAAVCTEEGCTSPGHNDSCELSGGVGWVCSSTCWDAYTNSLDAYLAAPDAAPAPALTEAERAVVEAAMVAYRVALTAGSTQEDEDASVTGVYGACEALSALRGARP
jgi:hypothetical protein